MHSDPRVMHDYGFVLDAAQSLAKMRHYVEIGVRECITRWAIEDRAGDFLGYVGVLPTGPRVPLQPHYEIGWRFRHACWGQGFAPEAAHAALADAFARRGLHEVIAFTATDNHRSEAVMRRLGMRRRVDLDFVHDNGVAALTYSIDAIAFASR